MKLTRSIALAGVSLFTITAVPALAQDAQASGTGDGDFVTNEPGVEETDAVDTIIVTARRRDEDVQEVPIVVNTVSAEDIADLNLRNFDEIEGLVPGLQLDTQGFSGGAQIRGVNFDTRVSGNNASVEFYYNDAPINGGAVIQQMFDIGQIEVLRGPQGTLRGRASPSGAITITTKKPDLFEVGGNVSMTGTSNGGINFVSGAGLPIIEGIFAIRAAGLYDVSDGSEMNTIATFPRAIDRRDSYSRSQGGRISAVLAPLDWLRIEGTYTLLDTKSRTYPQVESANLADSTAAASPVLITPEDRLAITERPDYLRQRYNIFTWNARAGFAGQELIYVGGYRRQRTLLLGDQDLANRFPGFSFGQSTDSRSYDETHELRLQNVERVAGMFDYVIGAFQQDNNPPTDLVSRTIVALPTFLGGGIASQVNTSIQRIGPSKERSYFGNITAHFGDNFEISAGARHIDIDAESQLIVDGNTIVNNPTSDSKWIYTAAANYFLNPDVMLYASTGTSFRSGPTAIGDFSIVKSARQLAFTSLPPEESTNYEVGLKSTLMGGRMRFNVSAYYQKFDNYPYRSPGVFYQTFSFTNGAVVPGVGNFNFVAAVPVTVKGIEGELGFEITPNWDISLVASYADGQIKNGVIPCNDLNGDGVPDATVTPPTLAQLQAAYGTNYLGACSVSQRSGFQAPFSATVQTEYDFPIANEVDGFARGLFSFFGDSQGDPQNRIDDLDNYGLLNLYAGIRQPEGRWELSFYGKNVFDTTKVTTRSDSLVSTSYQVLQPPTFRTAAGTTTTAPYRSISTTAPREFGVNFKYAFGSR